MAEGTSAIARGFCAKRHTFPAGVVETTGWPQLCVSVHAGAPVRAVCVRDGRSIASVLTRGDIEIIPAGEPGRWEDESPAEAVVMRLDRAFLAAVAAGLDLDPGIEIRPQTGLRDDVIAAIGWALDAAISDSAPDALLIDSLGEALACRLIRRYGSARPAPLRGRLSQRQLRAVLDHIDANLDAPLRLAALAQVAGVSASHFKTLFRRATGAPPHRYVVRRRVERAAALIQTGTLPLSEVALEAGFAHQSHLARAMRRTLGVTPTALAGAGRSRRRQFVL
jgi:AraC family transcriptional regulator